MAMVFQTDLLKKEKGFTLAELLIVILILGLLSSLAFYSAGDLIYKYRLDTKANELASDLRLAQQTAIFKAENISFILDGSSYTLEGDSGVLKTVELPEDLMLSSSFLPVSFSAKGRIASEISITLKYQNSSLERKVTITKAGIIKVVEP